MSREHSAYLAYLGQKFQGKKDWNFSIYFVRAQKSNTGQKKLHFRLV